MWPDEDDSDAALRGDYAGSTYGEVSWARRVAGALILAAVTLFAIGAVLLSH